MRQVVYAVLDRCAVLFVAFGVAMGVAAWIVERRPSFHPASKWRSVTLPLVALALLVAGCGCATNRAIESDVRTATNVASRIEPTLTILAVSYGQAQGELATSAAVELEVALSRLPDDSGPEIRITLTAAHRAHLAAALEDLDERWTPVQSAWRKVREAEAVWQDAVERSRSGERVDAATVKHAATKLQVAWCLLANAADGVAELLPVAGLYCNQRQMS